MAIRRGQTFSSFSRKQETMPNKKTTSAKKLARKKEVQALPRPPATVERPIQTHHQVDSFVFDNNEAQGLLPQELKQGLDLPEGVTVLVSDSIVQGGRCFVYLVGVCHGLEKSCDDVKAVINLVKPDVVFFESCDFRAKYSFAPPEVSGAPVNEMLVAYEEARKCGARIDLGDIPWGITLRKILGKLSQDPMLKRKFRKYKKIMGLSRESLSQEELNVAEIFEELRREGPGYVPEEMKEDFPYLERHLLHERDMFMSATLLNVAKQFKAIVAVVGWGHLEGIKNNWKHHADVQSFFEIPAKRPSNLALKTLQLILPSAADYLESMFLIMKNN